MIEISNEDATVLGILYEHHHYAPRIEEIMMKRGMNKWVDIDFSSIPCILKNLEENKLVESKSRTFKGQTYRKVYCITDEGRLVLKKKIISILREKGKLIYPIDLGLANINCLTPDETIQSLEEYSKSIEERIQYLEDSIKVQEENSIPFNFIAIYSRSLTILKAEKKWIEEFLEEINSKNE